MKKLWDWKFFRYVLAIAVPLLVQNAITNFVGLLDNIMIGQLGTAQMSGVSIINQLIFVFNLTVFGANAGPGIFSSQFFGSGNHDGIRRTFRYKLMLATGICAVAAGIFLAFGTNLISAWLHGDEGDLALTLTSAQTYLRIMLLGLLPFAVKEVYGSTLRETGRSVLPMLAGVAAVVVNLGLNYILIFGKLGAPALGVAGGAIATVCSRFVECGVVMLATHVHAKPGSYICGAYRSLRVGRTLAGEITRKGLPLMCNELLWSGGVAMLSRCYAQRGLEVVAGYNIASSVIELAVVIPVALGTAASIVLGQMLGAGRHEQARQSVGKLLLLSTVFCLGVGALECALAGVFPRLYNTTQSVRALARQFILVNGCMQVINGIFNVEYFTLRSGGRIGMTLLFDSGYSWLVMVPLAIALIWGTGWSAVAVYAAVQASELVKAALGYFYVRRGSWVNNLVEKYKA